MIDTWIVRSDEFNVEPWRAAQRVPIAVSASSVDLLEASVVAGGKKLYYFVRHTSRTGNTRHISLFVQHGDCILNVSRLVSEVLHLRYDDKFFAVEIVGYPRPAGLADYISYALGHALGLALDIRTL